MARKRARTSKRSRGKRSAPTKTVRIDSRIALVSLLLFLASGALGAMFTLPQSTSYRAATAELELTRTEVQDLARRLEQAAIGGDADLEQLYAQVQLLENSFPTSPSREELTVQVVTLAESLGVQVQRLDPAPDPPGEDLARYQFTARFAGSYSALANLLDGLDQLGPVVTLRGGQLSAQADLFVVSTTLDVWYVKFSRVTAAPEPDRATEEAEAAELERQTIVITLPESLLGGVDTAQFVAGFTEDSGFSLSDVRRGDDRSLSFRMLRTDHVVYMERRREVLLEELEALVEEFATVRGITVNEDVTAFRVTVDREPFEQGEGRAVAFALFSFAENHAAYDGREGAELVVELEYADFVTDQVFETSVLPE